MIKLDFYNEALKSTKGLPSCVILSGHSRITQDPKNNSVILTEEEHINYVKVKLGSYSSIAVGCKFMLSGNHDWERVTTYLRFDITTKRDSEGILSNGDIIIGNDVWIGNDCAIMSGVNIGHGSVIATGSVLTKDVEPYSIVGGVPAKFIKKRFSDDIIDRLLKSKWWDLSKNVLEKNSDLLFSRNIEEFLDEIEKHKV
jgi:acetyltransferase-like isoleucine patch superfamily enzyme